MADEGIFTRLGRAVNNQLAKIENAADNAIEKAEFKLGESLVKHAGGFDDALGKAEFNMGIALARDAVLKKEADLENVGKLFTPVPVGGGETQHGDPKPHATPSVPKPARNPNLREI